MRLIKALRELNINLNRAMEIFIDNGEEVEARPTAKITDNQYLILKDNV